MRIVATLLVRDEIDVLPACLEHIARSGVEAVIAADDGSTDGSLELLAAHPLVALVLREPSDCYPQSAWVSRMADLAFALDPDWIVHMDADEFWCGLGALAEVPAGWRAVSCPAHDHTPVLGAADGEFSRDAMPGRHPYPTHYKVAHRPIRGARIAMGNHNIHGVPAPSWAATVVEHYPVRSLAQLTRKAARGAEVLGSHPSYVCSHWRSWGRALAEGRIAEVYAALCAGAGVHEV